MSGETITLYAAGHSDVVRFVEPIGRLDADMTPLDVMEVGAGPR